MGINNHFSTVKMESVNSSMLSYMQSNQARMANDAQGPCVIETWLKW